MNNHHLLSVAPMLGWTDRHCRYFHRLIAPHAFLYTEMVSTGAILHGSREEHLAFSKLETPLALQLGGGSPLELAQCVRIVTEYGFNAINLNCGCPSPRVQKGSFGACLMLKPSLVADCWQLMSESSNLPITIKHRIGIDYLDDYSFLFEFVSCLYSAGCRHFIIHARKAWLNGLSPKENRNIPSLIYKNVYRIKKDFSDCQIIINGGIKSIDEVSKHLKWVDGVMIGREAYQNPVFLHELDNFLFSDVNKDLNRVRWDLRKENEIFSKYLDYVDDELCLGQHLNVLIKPLLGWRRGYAHARSFRRDLSNTVEIKKNDSVCLKQALKHFDIYL